MAAASGPVNRGAGNGIAGLVQVHVAGRGAGRLFACIEHGLEAVGLAVQQVEAAPPIPELVGSTTGNAADTATAASNALPPLASISWPA